jgi:predicted AAA+ superfamily ATPase
VLKTSFIVFSLAPHHRNFNKRLIKSPKLYFYDTGLACYLLGLRSRVQLETHPLRGALFENFVISGQGRMVRRLPPDLLGVIVYGGTDIIALTSKVVAVPFPVFFGME